MNRLFRRGSAEMNENMIRDERTARFWLSVVAQLWPLSRTGSRRRTVAPWISAELAQVADDPAGRSCALVAQRISGDARRHRHQRPPYFARTKFLPCRTGAGPRYRRRY